MNIVLVDASRVVLKILSELLSSHGHVVHAFANGEDALARIASDATVDVLITSLELPGMSGFEVCWEARLLASRDSPIYVLAMSSVAHHERLAEALDSGADDFIGKPPHPEELFARLRTAERISVAQRELIRLATRDPLTDLFNRRAFFERGNGMLVQRGAFPRGVVITDIDHFKRVNDTYGHDAGDQVIAAVAAHLARLPGIVGRIGGEEFAVVLPDGRPESLWRVTESLRAVIDGSPVKTKLATIPVTISAGTAIVGPDDSVESALRRADLALYAAKRGGRNCVIAADGPDAPAEMIDMVKPARMKA